MRTYAGSALLLFVTMAAAVGSYTINLKVSGERAAVEKLRRAIVADAGRIDDLRSELRTRARLPEMQRWNDNVLLMAAPAAGQYLRSPVQLASFGAPATPAEPGIHNAVTAPVAAPAPAPVVLAYAAAPVARAPAPVLRVAAPSPVAAPDAARIIRASYPARPPVSRPVPSLVVDIDASLAAAAPRDLLPEGGQ